MATNPRKRQGFTLIELLVVVSIIALLISILLPAVGETRRQARVSLCVSNMKQHGIGVGNYASQNKDTLPHAPISDARTNAEKLMLGEAGYPAKTCANPTRPLNGFSWSGRGIKVMDYYPGDVNHALNNSELFQNVEGWNGYWTFLSEYMVDGEGVAAMQDVFLSPSDVVAKSQAWPAIRKYMRENNGQWWNLDSPPAALATARTGSYRYASAAMTSYRIFSYDQNGNPLTPDLNVLSAGQWSEFQRLKYVRRNAQADVDYPAQKALFWMWLAHHNPGKSLYCQDGVVCPVALADGSARATRPYQEGLPYVAPGDPRRFENAGAYVQVILIATQETWTSHYWLTIGGIKGRDLP